MKDWLSTWTDKVQAEVNNAIKYVEQIKSMKYVETHMEEYANKVDLNPLTLP